MNQQTISELRSYRGTVLERAANEVIDHAISESGSVVFPDRYDADILDAFETLESFSEKFYNETGLLLTHSSLNKLEPFKISLSIIGGFGNVGVTNEFIDAEGYDAGYNFIVKHLIGAIAIQMKKQMAAGNFNFSSYIKNVAIRYLSQKSIGDRQKVANFLSSKLLPTYQRNRNRM